MKVAESVWIWRRRAAVNVAVLLATLCWVGKTQAAGPLGPSERPEAYFNGSSYIRLSRPISLKQLVGLSFRTCVGGGLFSQRFEGYTLHVTALFEQILVSWARPNQQRREVGLPKETLDNRWHWVALRYRPDPPSLVLEVDRDSQVISNVTWNPELLSPGALEAGGAVVLVGNAFSGCIHEGPQLEFHPAHAQLHNVLLGHCPLTTDECTDRIDVLREPPKDHCYNEPCMRHGTCISRQDRYECHCTARYTGNNCQVDAGDPCRSAPCHHGGRCVEDGSGNYVCHCANQYHGEYCELEVSADPQCLGTPWGPCRNNGSCSVPSDGGPVVCACPPGYSGAECETDVDECLEPSAVDACLNGGLCVDGVNNFTCDCTHTGYTGARCEVNVDECSGEGDICGHGVCYDTYGGFVCACRPGYTGERCHMMSPCASGPCGAGGACVEEPGGGFRCVCAKGWAPPLCAAPLAALAPPAGPAPSAPPAAPAPLAHDCAHVACPVHSECRDTGAPGVVAGVAGVAGVVISRQVACVCDLGYYGAPGPSPNCSSPETACAAGVCLNGATCTVSGRHVNCTCAPGFKGAYCEVPVSSAAAGKALSDLDTAERCAANTCVHAAACHDTPVGFRCECEAGYIGARCDLAAGAGAGEGADCRTTACPSKQDCVEQSGGTWRCAPPMAESPCASSPCHNGSCLALDNGLFRCQCPPHYQGRLCELDVDECALMPKICNFGVCVNSHGSYQCYCRPGYTGDSCDLDIDECLSAPCKNGGACQNLENNYECTCLDGFTGKDCSINIDECASAPCAAGSTCVDGVASYSCVCQDGLTGAHCELDIDDCESQPCSHGGRCVDALNGYTCDCAGTGYSGPSCGVNIDECGPLPCRHGATCHDDLNDYRCLCHPGYTGKNCETDINECESAPCKYDGVCLERSNVSLYVWAGQAAGQAAGQGQAAPAPPAVGPQPQMVLPQLFMAPFSYDTAAGYECVCVPGTTGARCEVNIDECASSPCVSGKCVDGVGSYVCECAPGYEGAHCELDINECQRYAPCAHGRCIDGRANYYCACEAGWGGRNCSVVLTGCRQAPCRNQGTCLPWLERETRHRFNCSCAPGYYGTTCEKITTMSLEKSSYLEVNTSREEGYDISFRFKTTLGSGLLAMGRGLTYFFLELSNGRLNLHSSLLNKWEGVFIGSNLNDSNWQKVFVTINSSHLVLAANEEQTIYPISQNEAYNSSVTSFPSTRLGTAGSSYATLTHGPNFFVGCFQDVLVNGQWVLPEDANGTEPTTTAAPAEESDSETTEAVAGGGGSGSVASPVLRGVRARCPRTPQCSPNPCQSGGACEDAWTSFLCTCPRPHLGDTCQYSYTAATFGQESAVPHSVVTVSVHESARRAVHAAIDISMFVRTRKPTGQIFHLGSAPRYGQSEETLVGASLKGGELLVHLRFNQTPEEYTVGGTRLDNGHLHLIEVVRNSTLVQVKLNGTEYFRKSISAAKQLDAQMLYLGGPPPLPPLPAPTLPLPSPSPSPSASPSPSPTGQSPTTPAPTPPMTTTPAPEPNDADYFKGVIQDVQVSNGVNVSVVQFFPLEIPGLVVPRPFGEVSLDPSGVLRGVVSDDACASRPCLHNATCTTTWNDYSCLCPRGYKGKQCAEVEFCQLQGCPLNSHCRNLDAGYECVSNATFDGVNTTLHYKLRAPHAALGDGGGAVEPPHSLTLTYRSKVGGTLLHATSTLEDGSEAWFSVGLFRGQVTVQWQLDGSAGLPELRRMTPASHLHHWTTLRLMLQDNTIRGLFVEGEGREEPGFTAAISVSHWQRVMVHGHIRLGGLPPPLSPTTTLPTLISGATNVATLEYMEGEDFSSDNMAGGYFKGCMGAVHIGNLLLPFFTEQQLFVGAAATLLAAQPHYALVAGAGWGARQGVGCLLCLEHECERGAHCHDVRSAYHCACPHGYRGDYCQIDVDECVDNQCQNGATCQDGVASYTCICPDGYDGEFCSHDIDACESSPCANGGTCTDAAGAGAAAGAAYTCACGAQWGGARCQAPRARSCLQRPCARGDCLPRVPESPQDNNYTCVCPPEYAGVHCEEAFCEVRPCVNGLCNVSATPPSCACAPGYSGQYCERERDACAERGPAACLHGGRCHRAPGPQGYWCDCEGTGWQGARCEIDVDECAVGDVDCGPGKCHNLQPGYICLCTPGFCGLQCALPDPCYAASALNVPAVNSSGPCNNGARCEQRCAHHTDYECFCLDGWGGKNCSEPAIAEGSAGDDKSSMILIAVGAALVSAAVVGAALAALGAQARRKRATRGTYSPSGQEYCNPRAEMMHNALKPPPEERLI